MASCQGRSVEPAAWPLPRAQSGSGERCEGLCPVGAGVQEPVWLFRTADGEFVSDADFKATVRGLNTEFQKLTEDAYGLEKKITENLKKII